MQSEKQMQQSEISINIENVVATAKLNQVLNLKKIIKKMSKIQYRPEKFPGAVMRLESPRAIILFFRTGSVVCTGTNSEKMALVAMQRFVSQLKDLTEQNVVISRVKIENMVATADLGNRIHLELAARILPRSLYEPEQFPGIIHRLHYPANVVILLFASGKIVCTGAKTLKDIYTSINSVYLELDEKGLMNNLPPSS